MSGGRKKERAPVRVVIITTQYIETDLASFKSVVQKLTGKDSHHYFDSNYKLPPPHGKRHLRRGVPVPPPTQSKVAPGCGEIIGGSGNYIMNSSSSSSLMAESKGVSMSELDRLVMEELPSWNELSQLCTL